MADAPTPMMACAEKGIYPEPSAPWFSLQEASGDSRFLNSGCLIGRAEQVRQPPHKLFLPPPSR
jgi:hypothetical protein